MPSSFEALTVVLVLLPGFLCARMVQIGFVRPQQTEVDKFVEALLYSFLIYVSFTLTFPRASFADLSSTHLVVLTLYSIVLGILISAALTNDWAGRLLRPIRVTQRTSNNSVWNDTFRHYGGYVLIELADGRLVLGWVRFFADREEQSSLFLEDAAWIARDGSRTHIDGPGLLLTSSSGIRHVMFVRAETMPVPTKLGKAAKA